MTDGTTYCVSFSRFDGSMWVGTVQAVNATDAHKKAVDLYSQQQMLEIRRIEVEPFKDVERQVREEAAA